MDKKKRNIFFLITSIIALVFATYILYETVFEQIISQSQGYFYAGVFGFILLLVFLLCNLFTKLVATSANVQNSLPWRITALVILGLICVIFVVTRMKYTSQLSAVETSIYKTAASLVQGNISSSKDLVKDGLANSANFSYAYIISILFRIFGESSEVFLWANIVIYTICVALIYRITSLIADRLCGLVAALCSIFIPSQTFSVYIYDSNPIFTLIVLLFLDAFIHLFSVYQNAENDDSHSNKIPIIIYTVILSIMTGYLLHIEFVMIVLVVLLIAASFLTGRHNSINILIGLAAGLFVFAGLTFVKSVSLDEEYGTVIFENVANFDPTFDISSSETITGSEIYSRFVDSIAIQDNSVESTYFFLYSSNGEAAFTELFKSWILVENQLIYMFLIIMFISCGIIAIKENFIEILPLNILLIVSVIQFIFSQCRDMNRHYYISLLIVVLGISVHYLYLNHHPELTSRISTLDAIEKTGREQISVIPKESAVVKENLTEEDFVKRARALVFIGNDEDLYQRIKNEEHRKAMASGNRRILENSFDDYDEDFFLDDAEDEPQAITKNEVKPMDVNLPAWKQKPEKFGDEDMFFDEDDEDVFEDSADVYDDSESLISVAEITKEAPAPEPVVEVVKRKKKEAKKADKKEDKKADKKSVKDNKNVSAAVNTVNNGKSVRRVKAVGATSKEIPNPLPTPKKKAHKSIDYTINETPRKTTSSDSGWDYAYDIDDDDDWDV